MYKPLGHSKNRNNPRVYRKGLEKETIVHPHNGVGGGRGEEERGREEEGERGKGEEGRGGEGERGGRGGGGEGKKKEYEQAAPTF